MKIPLPIEQRRNRPGNLINKVRLFPGSLRGFFVFTSGVFLSSAFPPLEWSWMVWVSLVPFLVFTVWRGTHSWKLGYLFGLGHFVTTFWWLSEVFFLAPVGLAAILAIFPASWVFLLKGMVENFSLGRDQDLLPKNDPTIIRNASLSRIQIIIIIVGSSFIWCALEWCRSWFFTGFPWNQLGISQWQNGFLLPMVSFSGVYGISFLIVMVNVTIFFAIRPFIKGENVKRQAGFSWVLIVTLLIFIFVFTTRGNHSVPPKNGLLRVGAVQGNIPQSRVWNQNQLDLALNVYSSLTKRLVQDHNPDLILWPETAIPASLTSQEQCVYELRKLFSELKTPLLAGSIEYRFPPDRLPGDQNYRVYNSALLFDADGSLVDYYDKIHLVPFGEYVPFEKYLPFLVEWIGMGRSLTEGVEYTVLPFAPGCRIGVNICYEDIFPEICARMVRNGANLLFVITNDAWFRESSGSRQHLAHTVLRAAENFRPILRNGNNSDTCLILPSGEIKNLLYDRETGERFIRKAFVYSVPLWDDLPITFYTRFGNWFPIFGFYITILASVWIGYRHLDRKRRLFEMMKPKEDICKA